MIAVVTESSALHTAQRSSNFTGIAASANQDTPASEARPVGGDWLHIALLRYIPWMTSTTAPTSQRAEGPGASPFSVSVFDTVGLASGAIGLLWSAAAALEVAPTFSAMFADFGGELPAFTSLCLSPWFPFVLGLAPLVVTGSGIVANASRRTRAILMGATIFLTLALPGIFLFGMYLPVFDIGGAIK